MGKQTGAGRHLEKPEREVGRLAVGPQEGLPRWVFSQLPRVPLLGPATAPQEAHGEGWGGAGRSGQPSPYWRPTPPREGEREEGGGKEEVHKETGRSQVVSREMG